MAYNEKYFSLLTTPFYDNVPAKSFKLSWLFDGFTGQTTEVLTNEVESRDNSSSDELFGAKTQRIKVEVATETLTASDFFSDDEKGIKFVIYDTTSVPSGVVVFSGYLINEGITEEYADDIEYLTLQHTDSIELLKDTFYVDDNNIPYSGNATIVQVLSRALAKSGIDLNLNVLFDTTQQDLTVDATNSVLGQKKLSQGLFEDETCYDVIDKVAKSLNCQVLQYNGEWWLTHPYDIDATVRVHKYNATGALLSGNVYAGTQALGFDQTIKPLGGGSTENERPYGKIESIIDLKGATSLLPNENFRDLTNGFPDGYSIFSAPEPTIAGTIDSFSAGGQGTRIDPYYGQINGYSVKISRGEDFAASVIRTLDNIIVADITAGVDPLVALNKRIEFSVRVKGNDVKRAYVGVELVLEYDSNLIPRLYFNLNESGDWVRDSITNFGRSYLFPVNLANSEGLSTGKYSPVNVQSKSIDTLLGRSEGFSFRILGGIFKIKADKIQRARIRVTFSEGVELTKEPFGGGTAFTPYVRYANASLGIVDSQIDKGAKSIKFTTAIDTATTRIKENKRLFNNYPSASEKSALLDNDGSADITPWKSDSFQTGTELIQLLDKELLQQYRKPLVYFDGGAFGEIDKIKLVTLQGYNESFITIRHSYNYKENLTMVRLIKKGTPLLEAFTDKKEAVFSDGTLVEMDTETPDSVIRDSDFRSKDTNTGGIFDDLSDLPNWMSFIGSVNVRKNEASDELGISFFDEIGDETDYIRKTTNGFLFKSEDNPYTARLDFSQLSQNATLKVPNLAVNSVIATANGLTTNYLPKLGANGVLGNSIISEDDFRVGVGFANPLFSFDVRQVSPYTYNRASFGGMSPDGSSHGYMLIPPNGGGFFDVIRRNNTALRFATETSLGFGFSTQMTLTADGKLGVKTPDPTHDFHVNGTTRTNKLLVNTATDSGEVAQFNGTTRTTTLKINEGATVGTVWQCTNADGSGAWISPLANYQIDETNADGGVRNSFGLIFRDEEGSEVSRLVHDQTASWFGFETTARNSGDNVFKAQNIIDADGFWRRRLDGGEGDRYALLSDIVPSGGTVTPTLQEVTDVGRNSTKRLQFNGGDYALVSQLGGGSVGNLQTVSDNGANSSKRLQLNGVNYATVNELGGGSVGSLQAVSDIGRVSTKRLQFNNGSTVVNYALTSELAGTPTLQNVLDEFNTTTVDIIHKYTSLNGFSGTQFLNQNGSTVGGEVRLISDGNLEISTDILKLDAPVIRFGSPTDLFLYGNYSFNFNPTTAVSNGARYAFEWDSSIGSGAFKLVRIN